MDGKMEADKKMSDSLRKAKAIVDLEYDEPLHPEVEAILLDYDAGRIDRKNCVVRILAKAEEIAGKK